jgi:hypothetical protein
MQRSRFGTEAIRGGAWLDLLVIQIHFYPVISGMFQSGA